MAYTKHTPGPWEARSIYGDKVAWEVYSAQGLIVRVDDYPHKALRAEPDAKLIAAAPALLEALKDVLEVIRTSDEWWMDCPNKGGFNVVKIEAAIAQAEGE